MAILYRVDDDGYGDTGTQGEQSKARAPIWLRAGRFLVAGAMIAGLGYAIVTIYDGGNGGLPATADVPVIQTNLAETRVRPEQPGGLVVPHRDRVILQRGPAEDAELLSTALLQPPPEEPLPIDVIARGASGRPAPRENPDSPEIMLRRLAVDEQPAVDAPIPATLEASEPADLILAVPTLETESRDELDPSASSGTSLSAEAGATHPVDIAAVESPSGDDEAEAQALDELVASVQSAEIVAVEPTPLDNLIEAVSEPGFRVQLVALQDRAAVDGEWRRLSRLYPDLLQGMEPLVSTPEEGRLVRVSAGPMAETEARGLCAAIQERGGDCFVRAID